MTSVRFPRIAAAVLVAPFAVAGPAALAQNYGPSPYIQQSATPDADALAEQMRVLATHPTDVDAMVRAGELTLKLDDPTAAAGFFARAERIDPSNPRIKAGRGTLLVMAGRPGEALQRFAEAESLRGDVRQFAADRGLAYDLIGEQVRAQREYRLALRNGPVDETLRRYALSLGISGQRDEALQTIDGLLRRSDRGAWRARAFILAMNGDGAGAERIAASMMPGGLGQGLQPFFDRLPRLGPADRAFAVHFGEVRVTPQRLADARLTPRLPTLLPEPGRPAAVAAAVVPAQPVRDDRQSRRDRRNRGKDRIVLATVVPPAPLPQPPAYQASVAASGYGQTLVPPYAQSSAPATLPPVTLAPVTLASNRVMSSAVPTGRSDVAPLARAMRDPVRTAEPPSAGYRPSADVAPTATLPVRAAPPVAETPLVQVASAPPATVVAPTAVVSTPASAPVTSSPAAVPVVVAAVPAVLPPAPGPAKGEDSILAKIIANITVPGSELEVPPVEAVAAAPAATAGADDAQATLIAQQKAADRIANERAERAAAEKRAEVAPESETVFVRRRGETIRQFEARKLAAAPVEQASVLVQRRGETAKAFAARKLAAGKPDDALVRRRGETAAAFEARKRAAAAPLEDDTPKLVRRRGESVAQFAARQKTADDMPALTRRPGEGPRAFEARKLAAAKLSDDDTPTLVRKRGETAAQFAARQKAVEDVPARKPGETARAYEARKLAAAKTKQEPKSAEPARIWVQVSGGANAGDLDKAWDKVRKDAPVAMRGKTGWMTPWRATNRVLAGPFKSDAEARGFVNALGKEGVSAFSFTSEAGQKVSRLGAK